MTHFQLTRHLCLSGLIILFSPLASFGQTVTIPDPNFVIYLENEFPSCITGNQLDTQCPDILTEDIIAIPSNVSDLYGIEFFTSLNGLLLSGPVVNVSTIPPTVTILQFWNTGLDPLPPLPPNIAELYLANEPHTSLPALPATLTHLEIESMYSLTTIPAYPPNLTYLSVGLCPLLNSIPELPANLAVLEFYTNPLISSLPAFPASLIAANIS